MDGLSGSAAMSFVCQLFFGTGVGDALLAFSEPALWLHHAIQSECILAADDTSQCLQQNLEIQQH
jgi:hypothetical protein